MAKSQNGLRGIVYVSEVQLAAATCLVKNKNELKVWERNICFQETTEVKMRCIHFMFLLSGLHQHVADAFSLTAQLHRMHGEAVHERHLGAAQQAASVFTVMVVSVFIFNFPGFLHGLSGLIYTACTVAAE